MDLARVDFLDSTILGELLLAGKQCREEHGCLILTNVPA